MTSDDKGPRSPWDRLTEGLSPYPWRYVGIGALAAAVLLAIMAVSDPWNVFLVLPLSLVAVLFPIAGAIVGASRDLSARTNAFRSAPAAIGLGIALFIWAAAVLMILPSLLNIY